MNDIELEITVKADGSIIATTHNLTGSSCLAYISVLEDMLEARTVQSSFTADFTGNAISDSAEIIQPTIQQDGFGGNV